MYEVAAQEVRDLFAAHLDGAALPLVCVVSGSALGNEAQTALASSARSLGYGDACAFVTLDGPDGRLDASSLLLLMEGLDPTATLHTCWQTRGAAPFRRARSPGLWGAPR